MSTLRAETGSPKAWSVIIPYSVLMLPVAPLHVKGTKLFYASFPLGCLFFLLTVVPLFIILRTHICLPGYSV